MKIKYLIFISFLFFSGCLSFKEFFLSNMEGLDDPLDWQGCLTKNLSLSFEKLPIGKNNLITMIYSTEVTEDLMNQLKMMQEYEMSFIVYGLCNKKESKNGLTIQFIQHLYLQLHETTFIDLPLLLMDAGRMLLVRHPGQIGRIYQKYFANSFFFPSNPQMRYESSLCILPGIRMVLVMINNEKLVFEENGFLSFTYELMDKTLNFQINFDFQSRIFTEINQDLFDRCVLEQKKEGGYKLSIKNGQEEGASYSFPVVLFIRDEFAKQYLRNLQNYFPPTKNNLPPYSIQPSQQIDESRKVLMALYLDDSSPLPYLFFSSINYLEYPSSSIVLFINYFTRTDQGNPYIEQWIENVKIAQNYSKIIITNSTDLIAAKFDAMRATISNDCHYYFTTNSAISKSDLITHLISFNKPFIAPLFKIKNSFNVDSSNIWTSYTPTFSFQRNSLYDSICQGSIKGVFSVVATFGTFLIDTQSFHSIDHIFQNYLYSSKLPSFFEPLSRLSLDDEKMLDIYFTARCSLHFPIYVVNFARYGYLLEREGLIINKPKILKEENEDIQI